jgi:outer membrane protein OmpA-like peptidoglycan-associated protein
MIRAAVAALGLSVVMLAGMAQADPLLDVSNPGPDEAYARGFLATPASRARNFRRPQPTAPGYLPMAVDLTDRMPAVGNQGRQGSCVAFAVAWAARSYYLRTTENRETTKAENRPSPAYIYNRIKPNPGCDDGSYIPDALNLMKKGAVSLKRMPYRDRFCPRPTPDMVEQATDFRIRDWFAIDFDRSLDGLKAELAAGHPIVFGISVRAPGPRTRGPMDRLKPGEILGLDNMPVVGGHAIVLTGYDDRKQAFSLQNSWGTDWADGGRGWISYAAFRRDASEAYVMRPFGPAPPRPTPVEAAPIPPGAETRVLTGLSCARIHEQTSAAGKVLAGFVGTPADLETARTEATRRGATFAVDLRPWPQCETLLTLGDAIWQPDRPRLTANRPNLTYVAGDRLGFDVNWGGQTGFVHLAYLQANGEVVHLYQASSTNLVALPGKWTSLDFGATNTRLPNFRVQAPFGQELLLAIRSAGPLFAESRPETEDARTFLSALRTALVAADGTARQVGADALSITTRAPTQDDLIEALKPLDESGRNKQARERGISVEAPDDPTGTIDIAIAFRGGSAQLDPESRRTVAVLAAALKSPDLDGVRLKLVGHTRAGLKGDRADRLSTARAEAIKAELVRRHGIEADRLDVIGRGARSIWFTGDPKHPVNDRVEVSPTE